MATINEQYNEYFEEQKSLILEKLSKENENKDRELEIEIKGSEKEINGISLEIFNFDSSRFFEFCDPNIEYLNSCLFFMSINLELIKENDLETIKYLSESLKKYYIPLLENKFNILEVLYRIKDKKAAIDIIARWPNDYLKNFSESMNKKPLHLSLKTNLDFNKAELYFKKKEEVKIVSDTLEFLFNLKLVYDNKLIAALLAIKNACYRFGFLRNYLNDKMEPFQTMFTLLDKIELKFNYDSQYLYDFIDENMKKEIKDFIIKWAKVIFSFIHERFKEYIKVINPENISFTFGHPKVEYGSHISIKIPGFPKNM